MEALTIADSALTGLTKQVVVITGGSSGIGLATAKVLLSQGALVTIGDFSAPPLEHTNLSFVATDVTQWPQLLALFSHAAARHGRRIDHVFANAGVTTNADYMSSAIDPETGELLEPSSKTYDVNLRGMINTCYIGMHYMRQQPGGAGSVVCIASCSSFQRFAATDYAVSKHGVLGFVRGVVANLRNAAATAGDVGESKIRINAVAPSWTISGMVSKELVERAGAETQEAEAVARAVALLMADGRRNGEMLYIVGGRYYEVEDQVLLPAAERIVGGPEKSDEAVVNRMYDILRSDAAQRQSEAS